MNLERRTAILEMGGDPTQPAWIWFVARGPHGDHFTWGPSKNGPAGYVGLDHLRETIEEHRRNEPGCVDRLQVVVLRGLESMSPLILRRAIQVLSVLGTAKDIEKIAPFLHHPDAAVSSDARACIFELKRNG